nr:flagellar hook-length control protein FliK [Falsiroseomonas frigidaquae]
MPEPAAPASAAVTAQPVSAAAIRPGDRAPAGSAEAVATGRGTAANLPPAAPPGASARARAAAGEGAAVVEPASATATDAAAEATFVDDPAAEAVEAEAARAALPRAAEILLAERLVAEHSATERLVTKTLATEPGARPDSPAAAASTELAARPPPPARAAAPVQVAWPARQVAPFAVALALGPDASLTLTLDPVELGRVEVAIDRSRGEAAIRITAERPETLALLQRDARELERALADAGFGDRASTDRNGDRNAGERGPTLSFSLSQGNPNQGQPDQGRPDQSGGTQAQAPRGEARRQAANDAALRALPPRRSMHPGLIDLAV